MLALRCAGKRYQQPQLWLPRIACAGQEEQFKNCMPNGDYSGDFDPNKCYDTQSDAALDCNGAASADAGQSKGTAKKSAAGARSGGVQSSLLLWGGLFIAAAAAAAV
jgi:hypothetical protein